MPPSSNGSSSPLELASLVLSPPPILLFELLMVYLPVNWSSLPSYIINEKMKCYLPSGNQRNSMKLHSLSCCSSGRLPRTMDELLERLGLGMKPNQLLCVQ